MNSVYLFPFVGALVLLIAASFIIAWLVWRLRVMGDMRALSADMALAENVAGIGYWSRLTNAKNATWSPGMYALFGQDPKTFVPGPDTVDPMFMPQDAVAIRAMTNPQTMNYKGGDVEARIRCPDGTIRDVLVAIRFRVSKSGKASGIFGVVVDITARKRAERTITEREEQLQRAISAMGAAIWDWDIASDRLFAGPRFAEILGRDSENFIPTMTLHHQLCHPADLPIALDSYRNHIKTGAPYEAEYRMRHSAGHYVWVHSRGRVVTYSPTQAPVRVIGTVVEVTERHEADDELRRSRESLELAMEVSQAGHFDLLLGGNEAYWSPRALEILGITDPTFRPTLNFLPQTTHPEDLTEFLANMEEFRLHNVPVDMQMRMRHAKGNYIWVHLRAVRLLDAAGVPYRTIGLIRDISANVTAQQALTDSERKFRDLIEGSLQGVVILRKDKVVFSNQAAARMLGYSRVEDLLSLDTILTHVPYENREWVARQWDRALRHELDGKVSRVPLLDVAGNRRWIESTERLIQWEGQPARQLVVLDVTEQENFQATLRASEERFRLLADNVSDVITLFDQDHVIRYVSPSIERVAGYRSENVVGRDMSFWHVAGAYASSNDPGMGAQIPDSGTAVWRMRCEDGKLIWVESTSSRVPSPAGGKGYAVVSALRDVSERVEREAELGAARDRLKNQADELTVLAQNLEMERERAEQANAAKSQFLAMMSHELRTPMTGIIGMADLLSLSRLTAEQDDLTKLLKRSARVLLDLLNDILDFSKIEAGQLEIESTSFNISEVLADVTSLFASVAFEKGIALEPQAPPDYVDTVKGDPQRLRQVLSNLVGNAIKFTERGRITISFEQTAVAGDSLRLRFSVADTGIGIEDDDVAKLFQPFVQADVSTSRKYGGTGLGLAISKRLVEGMGGDITVVSERGVGSTFSFTVDVLHDRKAPAATPHAKRVAAEQNEGKSPPRAILVAEDNETSRYLIHTMLTRMGHAVEVVEDGAQAVTAARSKDYDIILMDMQMPVLDGPDATRQIRKFTSDRAKIPIVALTADVIASHRSAYFSAGVNAIVGKPINWAELSEEIERQVAASPRKGRPDSKPGSNVITLPAPPTVNAAGPREGPGKVPRPPAVGSDVVLDEQALATLADAIGENLLAPMLQTFNDNMVKYRDDLDAALAAGDFRQTKRTAHALKGLCAQFGALRASSLAKFIETEANDLSDIGPILPVLKDTIAATREALAERQAKRASSPS